MKQIRTGLTVAPGRGGVKTAPSFMAPLTNSIVASRAVGSPTYTRATTAYVPDLDGIQRKVLSGEARFWGARRVQNLLTFSQDFGNAAWSKSTGFISVTTDQDYAPDGTLTADLVTVSAAGAGTSSFVQQTVSVPNDSQVYIWSIEVKRFYNETALRIDHRFTGGGTLNYDYVFNWTTLALTNVGGTNAAISTRVDQLINGYYRISIVGANNSSGNTSCVATLWPSISANGLIVNPGSAYVWGAQLENVTGQATQTVGDYVSTNVLSAPYQGAGVDGVGYFTTDLTNSPIAYNTLRGYLSELAATQLIATTADIRNMTGANWVKVTMTNAFTATGWDGIATSATTLTAAGANSTILLTPGLGAAQRTYSCGIKRLVGTGEIDITVDGATWVNITSQINSTGFTLVQTTANVVPVIGIRIVTNTDSIAVDFNQLEAGNTATSRIDTGGATRNADVLTYPSTGNIDITQGTSYAEMSVELPTGQTTSVNITAVCSGGSFALAVFNTQSASTISIFDTTNIQTKSVLTDMFTSVRKRSSSWGGTGLSITGDGATVSSGVFDGTMGSVTNVGIGCTGGGISQFNGTVKNVKIWTTQLPNSVLQAITA